MDIEFFLWEFFKHLDDASRNGIRTFLESQAMHVFDQELNGGILTPAELDKKLKNPYSRESQILFAAACEHYATEQQKLKLLSNPQEIIVESRRVQEFSPLEWQDPNAAKILPDPYQLKSENALLLKEYETALAKLETLRAEHTSVKTAMGLRTTDLKNEFNADFSGTNIIMTDSVQSDIQYSFSRIDNNAARAKSMHESSSQQYEPTSIPHTPPPPPMSPELKAKIALQAAKRDAAHSDVLKEITVFSAFTGANENGNLKPSDIKRIKQEQGQKSKKSFFQRVLDVVYDKVFLDLSKQEESLSNDIKNQEKMVNDIGAKLNRSNKITGAINNPNALNEKNPRILKSILNTLNDAVSFGKSAAEAARAYAVLLGEKISTAASEIKNSAVNFLKKAKNFLFGAKSHDEEIEMTNTSTKLSRSPK